MSQPDFDPHAGQQVIRAGAPLDRAAAALILIHGRGASAQSLLPLATEVAPPALAILAPQASGRTWYPLSFLAPIEQNEPFLRSALRSVDTVYQEVEASGIPSSRTVLLGFSQGACLALEYAARKPRRYGGVVGLSGGLIGSGSRRGFQPPDDKLFEYSGSLDGTPVFLGCSDVDSHIPLARVQQSGVAFRSLGADVTERVYPGMGHTVNEDEVLFIRSLLADVAGSAQPMER